MGWVWVTLCNIALKSSVIGKKLSQKLGSRNGLAPGTHIKLASGRQHQFLLPGGPLMAWRRKTNNWLFLTKYCVGLHNPHHSLFYTYGKLWAWRLRWWAPFFIFLVFLHCIFVFRKKYIFPIFLPNLTNQNRELPRKIYQPNFSKNCWFRLVSASLGEKSRSPTEVFSSPV